MNTSPAAPEQVLEQACNALWCATLSLMVAYMHNEAPAHRLLLARRIAANFGTLARQDAFMQNNRDAFARLAGRWSGTAERLAKPHKPQGGHGLFGALMTFGKQHL